MNRAIRAGVRCLRTVVKEIGSLQLEQRGIHPKLQLGKDHRCERYRNNVRKVPEFALDGILTADTVLASQAEIT